MKKPAKQTQRRRETMDEQLANRFVESYVIDSSFSSMEQVLSKSSIDNINEDGIPNNATKVHLRLIKNSIGDISLQTKSLLYNLETDHVNYIKNCFKKRLDL